MMDEKISMTIESPLKFFSPDPIDQDAAAFTAKAIMDDGSASVDTTCYPTCITTCPVRRHCDNAVITEAVNTARDNWKEVAPWMDFKAFRVHSNSPKGNFFAFAWPLANPKRAAMCAQTIEALWIYDDVTEKMSQHQAADMHHSLSEALDLDKALLGDIDKRRIQTLFRYLAVRAQFIDPQGGHGFKEALKAYLSDHDSQPLADVIDIETYTEYRIANVGFWLMEAFMSWSACLTLTEEEQAAALPLRLAAGRAMAMTNDLYSWSVERLEAAERGWNGVPVIMSQYGLDEHAAIIMLQWLVVRHEEAMRREAKALRLRFAGDANVDKYIHALELMIGGNCFWSSVCPRYNPGTEVNERLVFNNQEDSTL